MRTIELGCGTAYVSAWLARAGAHPVGIDLSEKQLATARAMQAEFGIDFPIWRGVRPPRSRRSATACRRSHALNGAAASCLRRSSSCSRSCRARITGPSAPRFACQ
ncbi:class I SAM-dependent methyltransferase [Streptomyces flaveus]|nr:methyltransferase domain-containing protein [Streptomyces flaveus]